jgi:hypothetical protein
MVLPTELARIVAVAHSWRTEVSINERLGLKNVAAYWFRPLQRGLQADSRQQPLQILLGYSSLSFFLFFYRRLSLILFFLGDCLYFWVLSSACWAWVSYTQIWVLLIRWGIVIVFFVLLTDWLFIVFWVFIFVNSVFLMPLESNFWGEKLVKR